MFAIFHIFKTHNHVISNWIYKISSIIQQGKVSVKKVYYFREITFLTAFFIDSTPIP